MSRSVEMELVQRFLHEEVNTLERIIDLAEAIGVVTLPIARYIHDSAIPRVNKQIARLQELNKSG